mmetsp:Transcript_34263/g.74944  ORF Transcript_34263/g.74944 Transcript_34263/m.74944 type:complete len:329 (-) Transcript_34263:610-1596(-)
MVCVHDVQRQIVRRRAQVHEPLRDVRAGEDLRVEGGEELRGELLLADGVVERHRHRALDQVAEELRAVALALAPARPLQQVGHARRRVRQRRRREVLPHDALALRLEQRNLRLRVGGAVGGGLRHGLLLLLLLRGLQEQLVRARVLEQLLVLGVRLVRIVLVVQRLLHPRQPLRHLAAAEVARVGKVFQELHQLRRLGGRGGRQHQRVLHKLVVEERERQLVQPSPNVLRGAPRDVGGDEVADEGLGLLYGAALCGTPHVQDPVSHVRAGEVADGLLHDGPRHVIRQAARAHLQERVRQYVVHRGAHEKQREYLRRLGDVEFLVLCGF